MSTSTGFDSAVNQTMISSWFGQLGADLERSTKGKRSSSDGLIDSHALEAADAFFNQARLHVLEGQYAKAEELLNKSLQVKEKILGLNHPDLLCVVNSLSRLYYELGNRERSGTFAHRALCILGQLGLTDHKELRIEFDKSELDVLKLLLAGADKQALAAHLRIPSETADITTNRIFKRLLSCDSKESVLVVRQSFGC